MRHHKPDFCTVILKTSGSNSSRYGHNIPIHPKRWRLVRLLIIIRGCFFFTHAEKPPSIYSVLLYVIAQPVATSNLGSMAEDEHRPNKDPLWYRPGESVP